MKTACATLSNVLMTSKLRNSSSAKISLLCRLLSACLLRILRYLQERSQYPCWWCSSGREIQLHFFVSRRQARHDLKILAVELTSYCNKKFLACCMYKPPQNINRQLLEEFNLCLAKLCSDYSNILLCGDFNFPRINWNFT